MCEVKDHYYVSEAGHGRVAMPLARDTREVSPSGSVKQGLARVVTQRKGDPEQHLHPTVLDGLFGVPHVDHSASVA